MNYVWGNYGGNGYLSLLDKNCTLKTFQIFSSFNVHQPNLKDTIEFGGCNYTLDTKIIFSYQGEGDVTYFFNENKVYRTLLGSDFDNLCLGAKLENITINAAAINNDYIMLATSNGLWSSKWR